MSGRITVKCADCGQAVMIDDENPPKDDDVISCLGCGRTFGTYAQVREAVTAMGEEELDRMIDDAGLPPWIHRTDK